MYWALWRTLAYRLRQTNDRLTRFFGDEPAAQAQPAPGPFKEVDLDIESRRAIFRELGSFGFIAMAVFTIPLAVGLIYEWMKGGLDW